MIVNKQIRGEVLKLFGLKGRFGTVSSTGIPTIIKGMWSKSVSSVEEFPSDEILPRTEIFIHSHLLSLKILQCHVVFQTNCMENMIWWKLLAYWATETASYVIKRRTHSFEVDVAIYLSLKLRMLSS